MRNYIGLALSVLFVGNCFAIAPTDIYFENNKVYNQSYVNQNITGDISNARGVTSFDADGDGDKDLYVVTATYSGTTNQNYLFINDGDGNFLANNLSNDNGDKRNRGLVEDLNGDGHIDLYTTNYNANNDLWVGAGNGNFTKTSNAGDSGSSYAPVSADFNGDGLLDLYVPNVNQPNYLWINQVSNPGTFVAMNIENDSGASYGMPSVGDVDNDGDIDIYVPNYSNSADKLWLNDGSANFSSGTLPYILNFSSYGATMKDFNGNGFLDIYVSVGGSNAQNHLLLNNPTNPGTFTITNIANDRGDSRNVLAKDVNGDSFIDIYVTNRNSQNKLWINDGSANFVSGNIPVVTNDSYDVALDDLNGDGKIDIYVANNGNTVNELWFNSSDYVNKIKLEENKEPVSDLKSVDLDSPDTHTYKLIGGLGDVDNTNFSLTADGVLTFDSAPDYEVPEDRDGDNIYEIRVETNDGKGGVFEKAMEIEVLDVVEIVNNVPTDIYFEEKPSLLNTFNLDATVLNYSDNLSYDITTTDLNADSYPDFHVTNYSDEENALYLSNGDGTYIRSNIPGDNNFSTTSIFIDVDGDGDKDLMVGNWRNQQNKIFINDGSASFTAGGSLPSSSGSTYGLTAADVDADGDQDIFVSNWDQDRSYLLLNNGSGVFTRSATSFGQHSRSTFVDVDGDGDQDLFATGSTNISNVLWINDGLGNYSPKAGMNGYASTQAMAASAADIDDDGDLDLVIAVYNGTDYILYNDGSGDFSKVDLNNSTQGLAIDIADIDNDGKLDFYIGSQTQNEIWINKGGQIFEKEELLGDNKISRGVRIVDFNNDGKKDLLSATRGGANLVFKNNSGYVNKIKLEENKEPVSDLKSVDLDSQDTHTYKLIGGLGDVDNTNFSLTADGVLTFDSAPDYEVPGDRDGDNIYEIRVETNDGKGGVFEKAMEIEVLDVVEIVNNVPTDIVLSQLIRLENSGAGEIGTLLTKDLDVSDVHEYSFSCAAAGTDDSVFGVTGNVLSTTINFDYEVKDSYAICIRTDDKNGGIFDKIFTISVGNVDESVVDSDNDGLTDEEEAKLGTDPTKDDTDGDGEDDDNNDLDNIHPRVELAAPNNGDANGDGDLDAVQNYVASLPNIENNKYNVLEVENETTCAQITKFVSIEESSLSDLDVAYNYELGLWDFSVNCATPGSNLMVKIYLEKEYETEDWEYRKYNALTKEYKDMSAAVTYGTAVVGSVTVTTISYEIVDGGLLDDDGVANGVIIDPAGPAVPVQSNTGGGSATTVDTVGMCRADAVHGNDYVTIFPTREFGGNEAYGKYQTCKQEGKGGVYCATAWVKEIGKTVYTGENSCNVETEKETEENKNACNYETLKRYKTKRGTNYASDYYADEAKNKTNKYYEYLEDLTEQGIINGRSIEIETTDAETTIERYAHLNELIKRSEAVKLYSIAREDEVKWGSCLGNYFPDVKEGGWYHKYVENLRTRKIVQGYKDGTFKPSRNISYAETFKVAAVSLGYIAQADAEREVELSKRYDEEGGLIASISWYKPYKDALEQKNILTNEIQLADPHAKINRGAVMSIMSRGLMEQDGITLPYLEKN